MKKYLIICLFLFPIIKISAEEPETLSFKLTINVVKCPIDNFFECEAIPLNGDGIYKLKPPETVIQTFVYSIIIDNIHFSSTLEVSYSEIGGWVLISRMLYFDPIRNDYDKSVFTKAFFNQNSIEEWWHSGISLKKDDYIYVFNYTSTPIVGAKDLL